MNKQDKTKTKKKNTKNPNQNQKKIFFYVMMECGLMTLGMVKVLAHGMMKPAV
jgi:hypothetical protein